MYRIFYGNDVLHDPFTQDEIVYDVTCYGGVNDKGSMNFVVNPFHPLYDKLKIRTNEVILKNDDDVLFVGYIHSITKNFDTSKSVVVYGLMGYLNDVYMRPYTYGGSGPSTFDYYIGQYNKRARYKFEIGINEAGYNLDTPESYVKQNTSYSSVASEIETKLLDIYGGYMYMTYAGTSRIINYASDVSHVNDQIIDFGVNLLDYVMDNTSENFFNALIAVGGTPDSTDENQNPEQITLADALLGAYNNFAIENDTMINQESVMEYGYKESVITYSDITNPMELAKLAYRDLNKSSKIQNSIVVKAIDLALYMDNYQHLRINDIVRIRSKPHGVDEYMVVTEMDLDLDSPENTEFVLGVVYDTLTGETSSKLTSLNSSLDKTVDQVEGIGEEAKAASKTAGEAMDKAEEVEGNLKKLETTISELEGYRDAINDQIKDLQDLIDGAIMTWFYPYPPSLDKEPTKDWKTDEKKKEHLGDLFYDTETGYCYRWMVIQDDDGNDVYSWGQISDVDVVAALQMASEAKDTADSKRRIFYQEPWPPYDEGDLWCQGSEGDILVCHTAKNSAQTFNEDDWLQASKYDNAVYSSKEEFYSSDSPDVLLNGRWTEENIWVDGKYVWRRTLVTYGDGRTEYVPSPDGVCISGNTGKQGLPGIDGKDGIPGTPGADGRTSYFHIKYSDVPNPKTADQMTEEPSEYIGTCVNFTEADPTSPFEYTWSKFQGQDGADGIPGKNGINGETSYLHIAYANSEDGILDFSVSESEGKLYIGQYTDFTKADSTNPLMYKWTLIKGEDGKNGKDGKDGEPGPQGPVGPSGQDGKGITAITEYYLISDKDVGITTDSAGWTTDIQNPTPEKRYLWNYEKTLWSDGDTTNSKPVIIGTHGADGTDGTDGKGIVSIVEHYLATAASSGVTRTTPGWTESIQAMNEISRYLWNYETINYTTGEPTLTDPAIIGVYGEKGQDGKDGTNGKDGKDGVGISSTTISYQLSDSGNTVPTGTWSDKVPTAVAGKYLWTKTVIHYTNNDTSTSYSVSYLARDGKNGTDGRDNSFYGTSSSAADAATKVVTNAESTFKLESNVVITVKFENGNIASFPYLKVNNTDAKPIMLNGVFYAFWTAGQTVMFVYDGQYWNIASTNTYANTSTIGNPAKNNVYIDSDSIDIRNGSDVNASFQETLIELGKNSDEAKIEFCDGSGSIGFIPETELSEHPEERSFLMPPTFLIKSLKDYQDPDYGKSRMPITIVASDWDNYQWAGSAGWTWGLNRNGRITVREDSVDISGSLINFMTSGGGTFDSILFNGSSILSAMYPVGSIYISIEDNSPANIFGGEWEKLPNDVYLVSQGKDDKGSLKGKTSSNTSHNHQLTSAYGLYEQTTANSGSEHYQYRSTSSWSSNYRLYNAGTPQSYTTSATSGMALGGSTDSKDYWPPYQVVYMWRRIS